MNSEVTKYIVSNVPSSFPRSNFLKPFMENVNIPYVSIHSMVTPWLFLPNNPKTTVYRKMLRRALRGFGALQCFLSMHIAQGGK